MLTIQELVDKARNEQIEKDKQTGRDLKPDDYHYNDSYYYPDYADIVANFGYEEILHESDDDYQGSDYVFLYNKESDQYGYLIFGWGSCSGCDWLQACNSVEDIQELSDHLHNDIVWFDSVVKGYEYALSRDTEVSSYPYLEKPFFEKVAAYFKDKYTLDQ